MVEISKKRKQNAGNPLAKAYSNEMEATFSEFTKLYDRWDKITTSGGAAIYPRTATEKLMSSIDEYAKSLDSVRPSDKIDAILIDELKERTEILKTLTELPLDRKFDYMRVIRCIGIDRDDIKILEDHFKSIDYDKQAEKWLYISGQSYESRIVNSEEEVEKMRRLYKELLRASFEVASDRSKENFSDFESYSKSVQFVNDRNSNSYQNTGRVYYNFYNTDVINVKVGLRYKRILDIFGAADLIGEEGLLGHQGQFLVNESANIPHFLKEGFNPATMINAETLGNMGSLRMEKLLAENTNLVQNISEDEFKFLKERFDAKKENGLVNGFMVNYESYSYFAENGKEIKPTMEALHSIVKSPMLLSERFANNIETYYNSPGFWNDYRKVINKWGYVFADVIAEKINTKLDSMDEEVAKKVRDDIQIGWWTRKGFEQYFDYLVTESQK